VGEDVKILLEDGENRWDLTKKESVLRAK